MTTRVSNEDREANAPSFAFYYPWPPRDGRLISGWVKTMLLFFDGVALLCPPEARRLVVSGQEEVSLPLLDMGLLRPLDPGELIDRQAAQSILNFLLEVATGENNSRDFGGFRRRPRSSLGLANEHWGDAGIIYDYYSPRVDPDVEACARMLWDEFRRQGLVSEPSPDGTIKAHPELWAIYHAFLHQAVRPSGLRQGLDLQPATDSPGYTRALGQILNFPGHPSAGHVVQFDLESVCFDLSGVPLDEILDFRKDHGREYRRYSANVRGFAHELAAIPGAERADAFNRRQEELTDAAADLRRLSRTWFRRPLASVALGGTGAAWQGAHGVWDAAILALLAGLVGGAVGKPKFESSFSYLFAVRDTLAR